MINAQSFLQPGTNPIEALKLVTNPGTAMTLFGRTLRWSVLLTLLATAMMAEVFLATQSVESIVNSRAFLNVVFMMLLFVVLSAALWVLLMFVFSETIRGCLCGCLNKLFDCIDRCTGSFVSSSASSLFGLRRNINTTSEMSDDMDEAGRDGEEWTCRMVRYVYVLRSFRPSSRLFLTF